MFTEFVEKQKSNTREIMRMFHLTNIFILAIINVNVDNKGEITCAKKQNQCGEGCMQ